MPRPVASEWNPNGDDVNCAACVARYLFAQVTGGRVADHVSAMLESSSQPFDRDQPFSREVQIRMAFARTESIIELTGLSRAGDRKPTGFYGRHPAGHYAVMVARGRSGHVVYGIARGDNSALELFDPQANARVTWGDLGSPDCVATRFVVANAG